jgi:hypothetical protein
MPKSAPADMKEFVACKRMTVVIDLNRLNWVPTQGTGFGEIRVESGATPNTGTVILDGPMGADVELGASIVDGMLMLDTSGIPGLFAPIRRRIDGWVKALNDTMKRNSKQLEGFSKRGSKITLTKINVVVPPPKSETGTGTSGVPVTPPAAEPPAEPTDEPAEDSSGPGWGCMSLIGAGVLVLGGIGAYFGFRGGDDEDKIKVGSEQVADEIVDDDQEPPTDEPATDEPAEAESEPETEPADDSDGDADQDVDQDVTDEPASDPDPPDEVAVDPIIEPFGSFGADHHAFRFPPDADVWDVGSETLLGGMQLDMPVGAEIIVRRDLVDPTRPVIGFLPAGTEGALEIFGFGETGQNGFTVAPPDTNLLTFGVPGEVRVAPCGGGLLFGGTVDDSSGSVGSTFYFDAEPGGFPAGSTGSTGVSFANPPGSIEILTDENGDILISGPPISDEFRDCLNDTDAQPAVAPFFNPPSMNTLAPIFGSNTDFFLGAEGGGTFYFTPTSAGNAQDCQTGEIGVGGQSADLLALLGEFDEGELMLDVITALTPALSESDWSSSVTAQVVLPDGVVRSFGFERHDGNLTVGEFLDDGSVAPADITLDDGVVRFRLPLDGPPDFIRVDGFNAPNAGDATTCDSVLGIADPFSIPNTPGRFEPIVTAPGDPFTIQPSPSDGTLFVRGDEQLLVRVLDACSVNDHFWVTAVGSAEIEFDLTVDDTSTGEAWSVRSSGDSLFEAITDTAAFATCP